MSPEREVRRVPPDHLGVVLAVPRAAGEAALLRRHVSRHLHRGQVLRQHHAFLELRRQRVRAPRQVESGGAPPEARPVRRAGVEDGRRRRRGGNALWARTRRSARASASRRRPRRGTRAGRSGAAPACSLRSTASVPPCARRRDLRRGATYGSRGGSSPGVGCSSRRDRDRAERRGGCGSGPSPPAATPGARRRRRTPDGPRSSPPPPCPPARSG